MTSYEPPSHPSSQPPINLLRGWPHPALLPTSQLRAAAHRALSDPAIATPGLLYGPDPGYGPLRASIAAWLTQHYHPREGAVTADRICISGGASQNLGNVLSVFTDPAYTRCVWVVAPAYFLAFRIFEDAGLRMRAVPEETEGPDVDYLEREIERVEREEKSAARRLKGDRPWAKTYKHVIYTVPTFANPSGKTTTLRRRKDLVALARRHDALIVCDDVYDFLQWPTDVDSTSQQSQAPLPRLVDLDRPPVDAFGNVASNGSLSKIAGPGIRVGWCDGTPAFAHGVSQAGTTKSGGAPSQLTSTYVNLLLEDGALQRHIRDVLIPAYARRWKELAVAVKGLLEPLGFRLPVRNEAMRDVSGGYFTWLTLPVALSGSATETKSLEEVFAARCLEEESVTIAPGGMFEVPGDQTGKGLAFKNSVRLCWSWEDEWKLAEGVERMGRVAAKMMEEMAVQSKSDENDRNEIESGIEKGYVLVEKKAGHET